jgi:putative membrane protein
MPPEPAEGSEDERSDWTQRILPGGTDPDPNLSLANERTFLAWIRTSLGLIALGVGVATFVSTQLDRGLAVLLSAGLIVIGGAIAAASWLRWLAVERALRDRRGIPSPRMGPALAFGVSLMAAVAIVAVILAL